ncbi:hypothetical protein [uncultured Methylobacterium sp.]|uniref:hypothetical protein n=1 Tax=uncultured Methylobacterium sp. TaxID=157278 RepID=UPI0035CA10DB
MKRFLACTTLTLLTATSVWAGNTSSNTSTTTSNGVTTRVITLVGDEDDRGSRYGQRRYRRDDDGYGDRRFGYGDRSDRRGDERRSRDEDEDDDED